ncbi:Ubiquitin carboxyl-terminal hydrolase 9 [Hibiscus syriacus]|uniref:Ubiquitin carboxyl-terminal hydrolase n=1 Tax=Hibiscus syriacus TaxID=106335 RepID=A0A6A3BQX7_HIBSY|nr:ubiquitin carboxyl-terminal hydrolase 9-like [Hibiscus syriacus]KAE8717492.1 Ubiquitin carboxyl-terminal hydrolase 9 [Hibiscus syriacus]
MGSVSDPSPLNFEERRISSTMTIQDSGFMMEDGVSCLPCTPEEQKRIVTELKNESESNLKEGNLYFVISSRWFRRWERYVGVDADRNLNQSSDSRHSITASSNMEEMPGPIDNSDIVQNGSDGVCKEDDIQLRGMLMEGQDYVLVPQKVWEKLHEWYKGGPALPRKMILQGVYHRNFDVEVYPLCLNLIDSRDESQLAIWLSRKASVTELFQRVCALRGVEQDKVRIWDFFNKRKHAQLFASNKSLEESNLQMDQDILLEQLDGHQSSRFGMDSTGNELALVSVEPSRSSYTFAGGPALSNGHSSGYKSNLYPGGSIGLGLTDRSDSFDAYNSVRKGETRGLTGLQNLGNTCFMNSALQCLVHTPPLVEYFLKDYSDEINTQNPLGMHGELALAFGELLRKLWSSGQTSIAPRVFKGKLARFAPQFSGYNQHDSQELLAFLLDGLHEDLNRVKQKPYIEMKDADNRPDEEVAAESWKNHKARNDSVIVDVCQGQYKSTLVCPVCSKISITFDPFMYLSLPLPSTVTRTMVVTVFYGDGSGLPMSYTVSVLKNGFCKDLLLALRTACCLKTDENLLLAEVYENKIYRFLEVPLEPLVSIKDDEHIVAFRYQKKGMEKTKLVIFHRWHEKSKSDYLKSGKELFGTPLITYLEGDQISGADIETAVSKLLSPFKRMCSSDKFHIGKDNDFLSDGLNETCSSSVAHSVENAEFEGTSNMDLSLWLHLTDDRVMTFKPLKKDTLFESGKILRVVLYWTDKEQELYDSNYLKDLPEVHKAEFTAKKTRQEAISLSSCLDAFLVEEPLGPDDMWYCPRCKEHRQAIKKLDLWKLPEIIVFHLKRFTYGRYLKNKIDTFVNFPIHNLDLSKYVLNKDGLSYIYELYAISNHYGGLGGGHYTAYAKLVEENSWYHFDDSHVSPVNESDITTSAAYLLFYKRVGSETKMETEESSHSRPVS